MPTTPVPAAATPVGAAAVPGPSSSFAPVAGAKAAHSGDAQAPLSLAAKRTLFTEGVCAWALVEGYPWWPTVLRSRAEVEPTLTKEDTLPPETQNNRLVEFFNDNDRIAVVHVDCLEEYTASRHRLEEAGKDRAAVQIACDEADAYIRRCGAAFQRDAIGPADPAGSGGKKARSRKKRTDSIKVALPSRFAAAPAVSKAASSANNAAEVACPPWAPPLKIPPDSPKSSGPKGTPVKAPPSKSAASKPSTPKAVTRRRGSGSAATTAPNAAGAGGAAHTVNGRRTRASKSSSLPPTKRPRVEEIIEDGNSESDRPADASTQGAPGSATASSPASTRLTLHLSRQAASRAQVKNDDMLPPPRSSRRRSGGTAPASGSSEGAGCANAGGGGPETGEEDWAMLGEAEETMEQVQKFAASFERFLQRKKRLVEEVERLEKSKTGLEKDNKELREMNKQLKTVNVEQQRLATQCQKRGDTLMADVAQQSAESDRLAEKIAQQRKESDELQRWYDDMHDSCAELRKERRELRLEVQALQNKARQKES